MNWYNFLAPCIPLLTRGLLCLRFRKLQCVDLSEDELDRVDHRTSLGLLAGFSFAALLAIFALQSQSVNEVDMEVVYYLSVSFLSLLSALGIQDYKSKRWTDQLATAIAEMGKLAFILAVVTQLFSLAYVAMAPIAKFVAVLVWLIDHYVRVTNQRDHLEAIRKNRPDAAS